MNWRRGHDRGDGSVIARSASDEAIHFAVRMDYFAEPVIGRAFARPAGSRM